MFNFRIISRLVASRTLLPCATRKTDVLRRIWPLIKRQAHRPCSFQTGQLEAKEKDETPNFSSEYGGVNIEAIAEGDEEIAKLLKILILEVDIFRQDGAMVPDHMKDEHWKELLQLQTRSSRLRYLTFLFKTEKKNENRKKKMAERRQERDERNVEADKTGHIKYGFAGSTIHLRVYDTTMDHYLNKNLINAAMFSQHLVLDCSYDDHMNKMEAKNTAKQITMLFSDNRFHPQPFHLQFCNINRHSAMMEALHRFIPPMYNPEFPMFLTEKSYLDLYPKERIVYLTPHCKHDLIEWNHDDVYVVGAIVDKTDPKPLSLAKAKQYNLRMAKLPLERHLVWSAGSGKSLTLNQMINILLDIRHTGSWEKALKHIPKRKYLSAEDLAAEPDKFTRRGPITRVPFRRDEVQMSQNMVKKMAGRRVDYSKLFND